MPMSWNKFLRWLRRSLSRNGSIPTRKAGRPWPRPYQPDIEWLEKRLVMTTVRFSSGGYSVSELAGSASIGVSLSASSSQTITVHYATSDSSAHAGTNYTSTSGTLTFNPGVTSQNFTVPILDDNSITSDLALNLALSSPTNATLGTPSSATLTINNRDPNLNFSAGTYSVNEDAGTATITVNLNTSSSNTVTVHYATSDGTAKAGVNYTITSGTLTFSAGTTSQTFTVPINYNDLQTANATVNLALSSPTNGYLGNTASATLTINYVAPASPDPWAAAGFQLRTDPEEGFWLANGDIQVSPQTGAVQLQEPLDFRQSVQGPEDDWGNPGGPPALVYNSDTAIAAPGTGSGAPLPIINATFGTDSSLGVPSQIQAQLTWDGGSPQSWVSFATTGHSAGDTYLLAVQVADGASGGPSPVPSSGAYPWQMTVVAHYSGRGDVVRHVSGTALVAVNGATDPFGLGWSLAGLDALQVYGVSVGDAIAVDAASTSVVFPLYLDKPLPVAVSLSYATQNGSAVSGTDYTSTSGTLTIAANATSATISVPVINRAGSQGDRSFYLNITPPPNVRVKRGQATGTIEDDNGNVMPQLTIGPASLLEGSSGSTNAVFTVYLSKTSLLNITVQYATADGTGVAGTDYTSTSGTLTITAGQTSGTISVPVLGNTTAQSNRTFVVNLSSPSNATLAVSQGTGLVVDDDNKDVLRIYGSGGARLFASTGSTSFQGPGNDYGVLIKNSSNGTFNYTDKYDVQWRFDATGLLTAVVDAHGLQRLFSYSSNRLAAVTEPDGAIATFNYDNNLLLQTIQEAGGRTVTVAHDGSGNLTSIIDPAGNQGTFAYDSHYPGRLTSGTLGPQVDGAGFSTAATGLATSITWGASALLLTAAAVQGLATNPADVSSQLVAVATDADSRVTTYALDHWGRQTQTWTPDGNTRQWLRQTSGGQVTEAGLATVTIDSLGRRTSYLFDGLGNATSVTFPDNTGQQFQYDSTFSVLTRFTD
jgi:YD repeat-containing protein